jgi:predicted RNA-binding Zn ribbon-like protein
VSRPAPGRLELIRNFLNTVSVARGSDELADATSYRQWLHQAGSTVNAEIYDGQRRQAIALRDALRAVVATHGDVNPLGGEELTPIRAAIQRPALQLGIDDNGAIGLVAAPGDPSQVALASLLCLVAEATATGAWQRLKLCRLPTCRWAYYDASPARAAVWCNMQVCGARHKARAYRRRRAANA